MVIQDKSGRRSHTVGVNSGLEIIYVCMENHELKINTQNFNRYCGPTKGFNFIVVAAELKNNRVHAKKT